MMGSVESGKKAHRRKVGVVGKEVSAKIAGALQILQDATAKHTRRLVRVGRGSLGCRVDKYDNFVHLVHNRGSRNLADDDAPQFPGWCITHNASRYSESDCKTAPLAFHLPRMKPFCPLIVPHSLLGLVLPCIVWSFPP